MGGELIPRRSPCAEDDLNSFQNSTKHLTSFLILALKRKKNIFKESSYPTKTKSPNMDYLNSERCPSKDSFSYYYIFGGYLTWIKYSLGFWTLACLEQPLWNSWGGFTSESVNRGLQSCLCLLVREAHFWRDLILLIWCKQPRKVLDNGNPREMVSETVRWKGSVSR